MLKILDKNFFLRIVADSVAEVHLTSQTKNLRNRWINAIAKATKTILEGDTTFLHWDSEKNSLLFWSADSNEIYDIGKNCQCPAYKRDIPLPCYHRAMSRLVKSYFEFQHKPGEIAKIDFAESVFFDSELSVAEKVKLLNDCILQGRIELKPQVDALRKHIA